MIEKMMKPQSQGDRIFFRDIKEPDGKDWEHMSTVGNVNQLLLTPKLAQKWLPFIRLS